jgi:mRNA interferase RelE/StbE
VCEILLEQAAERDLKKLPSEMFKRIIPKIKELAGNPKPQWSRKITGSKNDWRIRVGDYRIIYEIDARAKNIKVMRIRHRKDVYRS